MTQNSPHQEFAWTRKFPDTVAAEEGESRIPSSGDCLPNPRIPGYDPSTGPSGVVTRPPAGATRPCLTWNRDGVRPDGSATSGTNFGVVPIPSGMWVIPLELATATGCRRLEMDLSDLSVLRDELDLSDPRGAREIQDEILLCAWVADGLGYRFAFQDGEYRVTHVSQSRAIFQ